MGGMDLTLLALEEIAYEGLEGTTVPGLWRLLKKRRPPVKCTIDRWTKPFIWNQLAQSPHVEFFHVDYDGPKKTDIPKNPGERNAKMPLFWINDHINKLQGYSQAYFYRSNVSDQIKGADSAIITLEEAEQRWGECLYIVASQDVRRRFLYGHNNPPIIDDVIPVRYIILEIIGKTRWEGFMQADFLKFYGMDSRTSFHHLKVLIRLHLLTKQSILLKGPVNSTITGCQPVPPKSTKMLHLSQFSNVYTNNLQKAAAKICSVLDDTPDGIMERNELKQACSDIPMFKKIRQWLFQTGHIQYIVNGEIWNNNNTNPIQLSHFRAGRPCYVNLLKKFEVTDVEEDTDEFIDYIENCDDIEPQLVYEETLHHQAYQVIAACKSKGITMKKLAEVMCVPFTMARSFIRFFDTNKIGRMINVDHLKLKLQKIVAIQYLHECETVQKIKSNRMKIEQRKTLTADVKPAIRNASMSPTTLTEKNLQLADELDLTRVTVKSKISVRLLSRKNYVMDALKERPVFEGIIELYKSLVLSEENLKSTQGQCCRKTFRKILNSLVEEEEIKRIIALIDDTCIPPMTTTFYCAVHITEDSPEFKDALDTVKTRHLALEKKKELKKAVLENDPSLKTLCKGIPKVVAKGSLDDTENPSKVILDFDEQNEVLTDTDDESFQRSVPLSTARDVNSKFLTYARFQKLHVLHIYLWQLVYGVDADIEELLKSSHSLSNETFIDLVQSRHIWLQNVSGLPDYKEGRGWFNVGDILALMPLEVTCRVLGIKCWSETAIKYLQDPKKRLLKMCELPPRLKYKLLVSQANKLHIDNCVDLLVLLAQMGLVAVAPTYYPKIRTEIMLFLRKEAKITDTRFSEKTYCHVVLPPDVDKFPETIYHFKALADVEKYWTDLQFVCLNTPLGLNRAQRTIKSEGMGQEMSENDIALGKQGLNQSARVKGLGRNFRSFTILRDFTQYYQDKCFDNLEPVVFGNGLGAGGLDAVFFAHLAKNWRYGKQRVKKAAIHKVKTEEASENADNSITADKSVTFKMVDHPSSASNKKPKKIVVTNLMVKQRRGGKGLKRKLASNSNVLTKKMKLERKKYFDRMIAKRIENVREKIRQKEQNKKKAIRKGKKILSAMNHDDVDREALRRMKGIRVSFSEREDAYILLAEIVRAMMKLYDKGQPLEKEHKKVAWQAFRDLIHKEVPESRDKTWEAIDRRARNIKKYPHFLIIYNTCMAELEQDKDFLDSLKCTKEDWREKMVSAFAVTRESYSRHFNYPMDIDKFPASMEELNEQFDIEFAHKEAFEVSGFQHTDLQSERQVRTSVLEDLIHCSLTAQKLTSYIPAVAFKVFDAYPPDELNEAFEYYKENRLISRYRVDLPRRRSLPISTMTYNLSTTYYRMFEPVIPLRIYQTTRSMYLHVREGKEHSLSWKETDVLKLPDSYVKGSCLLNSSNLQGGHIAYLLSTMVNKKIFMDFSLPDEMTVSDEAHLKKLKEGKLNYQRVAFEQRIRRGETLVKKKLRVTDNQNSSVEKLILSGKKVQKKTVKRVASETPEKHSLYKSDTPLKRKKISNDVAMETNVENGKLEENNETKASLCDKTQLTEILDETKKKKSLCGRRVMFDQSDPSKEQEVLPIAHSRSSVNMHHHGVIRGFLKSGLFSCSYISSTNYKQHAINGRTCFMYTNEKPKTKRRLLAEKINMFKESKLHASRTSLSMQRSLTSEKLVPTNAMNTHDALVTNPMEIIIHSKLSPFRTFLTKLKINSTQKEAWKRCCENTQCDNDEYVLTTGEYCDILRKHLNFLEYQVNEHKIIIDTVRTFGVVGVKLNSFKEIFPTLFCATLKNWEYHIQILLNFKMLYVVGHYDDLLVAPPYLASWCFRYPQVASKFENKITSESIPSQVSMQFEECYELTADGDDGVGFDKSNVKLGKSCSHASIVPVVIKQGEKCTEGEDNESTSITVNDSEGNNGNEKNNEVSSELNNEENKQENNKANKERMERPDEGSDDGSNEENNKGSKEGNNEVQNEDRKEGCNGENDDASSATSITYRNIKVLPWLKLNGELNNVILKRFHETVLVYIMANPGVLESSVLNHFALLLKPASARKILNFLEINGAISKHYIWKKKATLFSSFNDEKGESFEVISYFMPTSKTLLNMTDTNR